MNILSREPASSGPSLKPWKPVLTGDVAVAAIEAARDVSVRLADPSQLAEVAIRTRAQTIVSRSIDWTPYSVSQGNAGTALLWSYLDACFTDEAWDVTGRQHLEFAVRSAESTPTLPLGIYSGLSGLAFAAWQLSRQGTRYNRLLATLDDTIAPQTIALANRIHAQHDGVAVGDFDVISGLSGIGAYLLCRQQHPKMAVVLSTVVHALTELLAAEKEVPRWHTPFHLLWDNEIKNVYPHGNLNCGLAHGVPGALAFLSLALREGSALPGLPRAIARTADWLCENRCDDQWGINWPTAVPLISQATPSGLAIQQGNSSTAPDGPSRCAWCYGSPGIARALWMAGDALHRQEYRDLAVSAMEAVFRRPVGARRIDSPTFCHGVAGLLQIALRFAHDTERQVFVDESRILVQQLLENYRPESLLGFRNMEVGDHEIDQPGLLDGSSGVALVLLAAATIVEPTWDRLFLLS